MRFDRRSLLRATGGALGGGLLLPGAAAASHECDDNPKNDAYSYQFVGEAVAPNPTEVKVRDNWAFAATSDSVTSVDVSDPSLPVLADRARAPRVLWEDLKLGGSDGTILSMSQDDDDPGGIVLYDVSDPANLARGRLYETGEGVHNHFIDKNRDLAYLCISDPFTNPRMVIVDVSDGLADDSRVQTPISRENVGPNDPVASIFRLADINPAMAEAGINVAHDIFVEQRGPRHVAHVCFWDAGIVSVDVTEPSDPFAVAHFNAVEDADVAPRSEAEFNSRYIGMPGNSHYSRVSPDGDHLYVGAEAYPDPTGTAIPDRHGGIKVYDLTEMNLRSPLNPDSPTYDPTGPAPIECIDPPNEPRYGALRTSHNFDITDDGTRLYSAWYQGGIRAYDISDPSNITELAAHIDPNRNAFWGAQVLTAEATNVSDDGRRFTVGSDRNGEGLVVLELVKDGGSGVANAAKSRLLADAKPDRIDRSEVFRGTMAERLRTGAEEF